ncbi:hypothetical protein [Saccharopolyspora spinosa]|uniref:Uncharacterized protein n=1 Tax=Saccharopolyspora spinosa TaxID=60894 RepID=A0A2N3XTY7_SACSN|nr:hypothetical protein [Saccharopolyspora spinosa]PKW14154.1 hypothetical protein A8926_1749 [Saccharopolyspora spinosa]
MWFLKKQQQEYLVGDSSKGGRRREELTCPGHKPHYGEQITGMTVRWHCECGAYRDEIDAPPPPGNDMPSGDYLEMRVRGIQGDTSAWRSQVTGKPLPVKRDPVPPAGSTHHDTTPAAAPATTTNTGGTSMAGIEEIIAAISNTSSKSEQIQGALAQVQQWATEVAGQLHDALGGSHQPEVQQAIEVFSELSEVGQRITELHQLVSGAVSEIEQYGQRL